MGQRQSVENPKLSVPSSVVNIAEPRSKETYVKTYDDFIKESTPVRLNSLKWTLPIDFEKLVDIDKEEKYEAEFKYDNYQVILTMHIEKCKQAKVSRLNLFHKNEDKLAREFHVQIFKLKDRFGKKDAKSMQSETFIPVREMLLVGPKHWEYMLYETKYGFMVFDTPENKWHEKILIDPNRIVKPIETFVKTRIGWKETSKSNSKTISCSCPAQIEASIVKETSKENSVASKMYRKQLIDGEIFSEV